MFNYSKKRCLYIIYPYVQKFLHSSYQTDKVKCILFPCISDESEREDLSLGHLDHLEYCVKVWSCGKN